MNLILEGKYHNKARVFVRYIENGIIRRIIDLYDVYFPYTYNPFIYNEIHPFAEYLFEVDGCTYIYKYDINGIQIFQGEFERDVLYPQNGLVILPTDLSPYQQSYDDFISNQPTPTSTPPVFNPPEPTPSVTAPPITQPSVSLVVYTEITHFYPSPNENVTRKRLQWIEGQLYDYDITMNNGEIIRIEINEPTPEIITNINDINTFINRSRGWVNNQVYKNIIPDSGTYVTDSTLPNNQVIYSNVNESLLPYTYFNRVWVDFDDTDFAPGTRAGNGSGVIITPYVYLTNEHVLSDADSTPNVPDYDLPNEDDTFIEVGGPLGNQTTRLVENELGIIPTQNDNMDISIVLFQPSTNSIVNQPNSINQTYLPLEFDGLSTNTILHTSGYPARYNTTDPRFADNNDPFNSQQRKISFIPTTLPNGMYFTQGQGNGLESGASGSPTLKRVGDDLVIVGLHSKSTIDAESTSSLSSTSFGGVAFTQTLHYDWIKSWLSSTTSVITPSV